MMRFIYRVLGLKRKPQVMVAYANITAAAPYIIKARGGDQHGYDWEQIVINSHFYRTALALERAEEYAKEIGGTVLCV